MYFQLYSMLQQFFYGAAELSVWMDMTLTVLSTIGILIVFAIPFAFVWILIKGVIALCGR